MDSEPSIAERPEQHYAAIRHELPMSEFPRAIAESLPAVAAWLGQHGTAPAGAPLIRYLVTEMPNRLVVDIGWPTASAVQGDGRVQPGTLPDGSYASLVH